ncbi:NADH-quinone oxidoreductase subunit L, partial [Modestobacter lapidis]|nr:NADH-quinone oxidoreductase subunit L [Modestobacter lapidis]
AGAIIHSVINESQDLRTYGGFLPFLPLTYTCILIASLSLMAIPSLTGFYSKDIILETLVGSYQISGFLVY